MSGRVLLYGATGYTGREVAAVLAAGGTDVILAGRDADRVRGVAEPLGRPWVAFELAATAELERALAGVEVVLHAAGPFAATAAPMVQACLRRGAHYLDLGGEWPVFRDIAALDSDARDAGVMLMPGVGLTVAATDCLLALAKAQGPDAVKICLGVSSPQVITRGTVLSAATLLDPQVVIRRGGRLASVPAGRLWRAFDFGQGLREAVAMSWADVVTAGVTTGVADVEVYSEVGWMQRMGYRFYGAAMATTGAGLWRRGAAAAARAWPETPPEEDRRQAGFVMVAEAIDPWRRSRFLRMRTVDGYSLSVATAAAAVRRVLDGASEPGFQTPARVFGASFVLETGCAAIEDAALAAGGHAA